MRYSNITTRSCKRFSVLANIAYTTTHASSITRNHGSCWFDENPLKKWHYALFWCQLLCSSSWKSVIRSHASRVGILRNGIIAFLCIITGYQNHVTVSLDLLTFQAVLWSLRCFSSYFKKVNILKLIKLFSANHFVIVEHKTPLTNL